MKSQSSKNVELSDDTKTALRVVALDEALQRCVVEVMFRGCKRGLDLWEELEPYGYKFSKQTSLLLWGKDELCTQCDEDEEHDDNHPDQADQECIYTAAPPHDVIEYLLDRVQENILAKLA